MDKEMVDLLSKIVDEPPFEGLTKEQTHSILWPVREITKEEAIELFKAHSDDTQLPSE